MSEAVAVKHLGRLIKQVNDAIEILEQDREYNAHLIAQLTTEKLFRMKYRTLRLVEEREAASEQAQVKASP